MGSSPDATLFYGAPLDYDEYDGVDMTPVHEYLAKFGWDAGYAGVDSATLPYIYCEQKYFDAWECSKISLDMVSKVPKTFKQEDAEEIAKHFGIDPDDFGWRIAASYG